MVFGIAEQPLESAIAAFAIATDSAALFDVQNGRSSMANAVTGLLDPKEAAKIMLAGTGLQIRFTGAGSFVVENAVQSIEKPSVRRDYEDTYFAQVQKAVMNAACRDLPLGLGTFDATVQLWLASDGRIRAVHIAGSSADAFLNETLRQSLLSVAVLPPSSGVSQPLTLAFEKQKTPGKLACRAQ